MPDKKVVMCDFRNLRPGMLVQINAGWSDSCGKLGVIIDRITYAHMLGEGANESYDPMLIVMVGSKRLVVPVDAVERIEDDTSEELP
jgi:hypothetical protein